MTVSIIPLLIQFPCQAFFLKEVKYSRYIPGDFIEMVICNAIVGTTRSSDIVGLGRMSDGVIVGQKNTLTLKIFKAGTRGDSAVILIVGNLQYQKLYGSTTKPQFIT